MFAVFRNALSVVFLRSGVPDRQEPGLLMKQLSAHHRRFCRDEARELMWPIPFQLPLQMRHNV